MSKIELAILRENWLAGNAVIAFVGALLLGQSWHIWGDAEGSVKLLYLVTVPDYTEFVILGLMAALFVLSLLLALASTARPLQGWAIRTVPYFSPTLGFVALTAYTLLWVSASAELLSFDQWWSEVLFWGGFGIFLFILFRILYGVYRPLILSDPKSDAESHRPKDVVLSGAHGWGAILDRMHSLSAYHHLPQSRGFWITTLVLALVVVGETWFAVVSWDWLGGNESEGTTLRNVILIIGSTVAFPLAIWRALIAYDQASVARGQAATAQQGLLNDRYQSGITMFGSDVLSVRLSGIYDLHRLAKEHPGQYHVLVMQLFCAFARNPTNGQELVTERVVSNVRIPMLREDVQAVINSIRHRRDTDIAIEKSAKFRLQLEFANLQGAVLYGADLRNAFLWGTNLSGAYLANSRLDAAVLCDANLSDVQFSNEGDSPASGLTQQQLDKALADPKSRPKLIGVLDAETGDPLEWRGTPIADHA